MDADLQQTMQEHGEYCLRIAYLYTKDWALAEEIVQDVFVAYFQQRAQFRQQASLKTYLTKITINKSKNALRFKWAKKRQVQYIHIEHEQSSEQTYLQKEKQQSLVGALLQLPLKYREPLILYYYEDFTTKEIAQLLVLNENTVKTRMKRGREKLKLMLSGEGIGNVEFE